MHINSTEHLTSPPSLNDKSVLQSRRCNIFNRILIHTPIGMYAYNVEYHSTQSGSFKPNITKHKRNVYLPVFRISENSWSISYFIYWTFSVSPVVSTDPRKIYNVVIEGNTASVTCIVDDANPSVITGYRWYKETARSKILSTDATYSIPAITTNQSGLYHCEAQNSVGWSKMSAYIHFDVTRK